MMQLKRTECFHRHIGGLTLLFVVILFAVVSSGANDHGHSSSAETTSSVHTGHASEFDKSLKMPRPLAVMIDEFIANTEKNKSAEKEAAGSTSILDKVALAAAHGGFGDDVGGDTWRIEPQSHSDPLTPRWSYS